MQRTNSSPLRTLFFNVNYFTVRWVANLVFRIFYSIDIKSEGVVGHHGPAVILPKHQYWTDIPLVMLSFRFPVHFVAKQELFRPPGVRSYLLLSGCIPLDREKPIKRLYSFKYLFARLKADGKVVIYPEGTYFPETVGSGKSRLIQMILQMQSELKGWIRFIPVGIHYGGKVGWRRRVEIRIGEPLFADSSAEAASFTHRVMREIGRLSCLP